MKAKKRGFIGNIKKYWQLYLFLLLPLAYIIVFAYGPMVGLQIAFRDFNASKGIFGSPWVGLKYFEKFIHSYQFGRIIRNTFVVSLYSLIARFPIPIILAICINVIRNKYFKKTTQMIVYMPHFISVVVLVGMINQFFNPFVGLYGNIYKLLFNANAPDLMTNPSSFLHMYVWSGIWQNAGWDSIIYIAALSSVSQDLHEAAQVDGASRFRRVLSIDLPAIMPTIVILLVLNTGQIMNLGFEKIFLMQNNVNLRLSEVISTYVYKEGISPSGGNYSYATAIGLFNSIVNFVLVVGVNKVAQKFGGNSLW
ncbi:MAG: ABC transporter permease subunit [Clostridia bacterium]|nr:ABC transporter permease subunit [Clostridia bacterium]